MVAKIIRDYMEGGKKKLTVPGFGTFMRKDSGEMIFVDLLRKDDGVLRELVENYGHYSDVEAMALVDRFIFETKNGIEKHGSTPMDGFGTMYIDEKGLYQFDYSSLSKQKEENPVLEKLYSKEKSQTGQISVEKNIQNPTIKPEPQRVSKKVPSQPRTKGKKSKPDTLIIVAIVAAAIAILIMIFGLSSGNIPFLSK